MVAKRIEPLRNTIDYCAYIESISKGTYLDLFRAGLEYIRFGELVSKDARVFIKPNLTFPAYRPGVMTSPQAVEAAVIAIKEYTPNIYLGDSDSGGYNRFSMDEVYRETGLWQLGDKYCVQVVNLSKLERKFIHFEYKNKVFKLALPRLLTDDVDLLVSMPVPKVHAHTGVSLAFKNQWGCIPENEDRLRFHPYFSQVVLEVNKAIKARVAIIDGKYGLNVNGPMKGQPVELNWVLLSNDVGAATALACELMQIPLEKIKHLKHIKKMGFVPELSDIKVNQDFRPFMKEKFVLKRAWTDYPGYFAFHNPILAYIAYFSPLAGLLHRLLYLFREPYYDYNQYSAHRH